MTSGGRAASAIMPPSTIADAAIPISTPGTGTPRIAIAPPSAMTIGNVIGSSQIAGGPRKAPHSPTATIATTWSSPNSGCAKPPRKPPVALPSTMWAKAGRLASTSATRSATTNAPAMLLCSRSRMPTIRR